MKIGEVTIGTDYGAVDEPTGRGRYSGTTPRQVRAEKIVTVEEQYWRSGGRYSSSRSTRNVRRIKVTLLDEPQQGSTYYRDTIKKAAKGTTLAIEARQLVAKWSDVHPGILARAKEEQARAAKQTDIENRLKSLGFKKLGYGDVYVYVSVKNGGTHVEIDFNDDHAEKLLKKLEASV